MHITHPSLLATIDKAMDGNEFDAVAELLAGIAGCDNVVGFRYVENRYPEYLYARCKSVKREKLYERFVSGLYEHSPYYQNIVEKNGNDGFYQLSNFVGGDFHRSLYYREFLRFKEVEDEGIYYFQSPQGGLVVVAEHSRRRFTECDLSSIAYVLPLVRTLLKRRIVMRPPQVRLDYRAMLRARFQLTGRETDVAEQIILGSSTKVAARRLGISPHTERVHRRRLYHRLGIRSHAELCSLVIKQAEQDGVRPTW